MPRGQEHGIKLSAFPIISWGFGASSAALPCVSQEAAAPWAGFLRERRAALGVALQSGGWDFLGAHKEKASSEATWKEEATLKPHKKRGRCLPALLVLEELQADRSVKESKSSRALQVK